MPAKTTGQLWKNKLGVKRNQRLETNVLGKGILVFTETPHFLFKDALNHIAKTTLQADSRFDPQFRWIHVLLRNGDRSCIRDLGNSSR